MPTISKNQFNPSFLPTNYPQKMIVKLSTKIKLKKDYVRSDGTCAVFVQLYMKGKKTLPLNFSVSIADFDEIKQRVKRSNKKSADYNLIIEQMLATINTIEVNYRLSGRVLTLENLIDEINNPTAQMDFIKFWENEMIRQKETLAPGTYRQQNSVLKKLSNFKKPIYFKDINDDLIADLKTYCRKKLKNTDATISTTLKSFKKYLHLAQKKGIFCGMNFTDIKNKQFKGNRTFLNTEEVTKFYTYWQSEFITETKKNIISRYLFSCFTGLRFSDIQNLTTENFINDTIVFTSEKTKKFQRIPLNKSALKFVDKKNIFLGNYTGEYMNRELKEIANILGIRKKITFHTSRHTFATNFLICGGRVEHLQKILGHSKITDTMIYVHIIDSITDVQIFEMDKIFKD